MQPLLVVDEPCHELSRSIEAARIAGFRTFSIPRELPRGIEMRDVLSNLRDGRGPVTAALEEKGFHVVVSPSAHRQMLEVDSSVAALRELTTPIIDLDGEKPFPLFLKGAVQSLKHDGVTACVAHDESSLQRIVQSLHQHSEHSRGRVIARPLLKLRHVRTTPSGFPAGREYRAVVFHNEVMGLAPYWDGVDSLTALSSEEADEVNALVVKAQSVGAVEIVESDSAHH